MNICVFTDQGLHSPRRGRRRSRRRCRRQQQQRRRHCGSFLPAGVPSLLPIFLRVGTLGGSGHGGRGWGGHRGHHHCPVRGGGGYQEVCMRYFGTRLFQYRAPHLVLHCKLVFVLLRAKALSWSSVTFLNCPQLHVGEYYFILFFQKLDLKLAVKKSNFKGLGTD